MILIADSGSTKTDWCVVEHGQLIQQISTKGTNPFFQSEEEISNEIATALIPQLKTNKFEAVHFYGAGCAFPDKIETMRKAIASHLQVSGEIEVSTGYARCCQKFVRSSTGYCLYHGYRIEFMLLRW